VFQDGGEKLGKIYELGWNRVSFGVQDLDPQVQEAIHRRQTEEMTVKTYLWAREIGFTGINLDLIYGLPYQTVQTFTKTIEKIIELRPDRISLFSYAKVPWLKPHQKAIDDALLPSTVEKFTIYTEARTRLIQAGYVAIGMDHFSLQEDAMAKALREKQLQRNFQGYSLNLAKDMIGLGMSSIGFVENIYFQNHKTIAEYEESVREGILPVSKGYVLHADDLLRAWVIQEVMCHFVVDKREFQQRFGVPFDLYFAKQREPLEQLEREGLVEMTQERLRITPMGEVLVRLVASVFDAYLGKGGYSKAV
jgi:oxygen-independent coproporphyrinogen-3 oxidase